MKTIAHRGYSQKYPENTICAFEQALFFGAAMIELDVYLSQDQKIVVIHDHTLDRTTNGSGLVSEHTYDQLQTLDAGSWFAPQFASQGVPLLSEVLAQFGKDIALNIEIKKEAVHLDPELSIEAKLHKLLQQYPGCKQIQLSCFEPLALHRLRGLDAQLELCYLTEKKLTAQEREEMTYLEVIAQHICIDEVDREEVDLAKKQGIVIRAYTIDSKHKLEKAKRLDLDGIFSNELDLQAL